MSQALVFAAIVLACAAILFITVPDLDRPRNDERPVPQEPPEPLADLEPRTDDKGPEPPGPALTLAA